MATLTVEQALEMPIAAPERLALMRELSASPTEADQAQYRRLYYDAVRRSAHSAVPSQESAAA